LRRRIPAVISRSPTLSPSTTSIPLLDNFPIFIPVELNENVQAGQHIVILPSLSNIEVSTSIPEKLIFKIHINDPVSVTFDALRNQTFHGKINEVAIMSDVSTTYPVTLQILEKTDEIRSGMTAEVHFFFIEGESKIYIPSYSLFEEDQQEYVFLIKPTEPPYGQVYKQEIKIGKLSNNGIEVVEGLKVGDLLITAGIRRLKEGNIVFIKPELEQK